MARVKKVTQRTTDWKEALQQFLFWKQAHGLSETTINDYKRFVERFFRRYPECWQTSNLKTAVMEFMAAQVKPATYNLLFINLRAFFDWSVKEGYLQDNPLQGFKRRKADPRIVDISADALQSLLSSPNQSTFAGLRDYALILLTLDTGIRPKEALSLTMDNFDLTRYAVTIPDNVAKTRNSRILPMLPQTVDCIRKLISVRPEDWDKSVPIFCTYEGSDLSVNSWGDRLEMYSKKIAVKIRPYDLRHSFALMYLRNGGHAFGLQRMMGHADMNMTKTYVNLTGQDLQKSHRSASPLNTILPKKKSRLGKL